MSLGFRSFAFRSAILVAALAGAFPAGADLIGAEDVLRRLERPDDSGKHLSQSKAAELLADIKAFRGDAQSIDPAAAARAWLSLYERAVELGSFGWQGDPREFDAETSSEVGLQSVLASLPGPEAWPQLHNESRARSDRAPGDRRLLAARFIAELLNADLKAGAATLAEMEREAAKQPPGEREASRSYVAHLRAEMARLYGTPEEIATSFVSSLEAQARLSYGEVRVPDLVHLVGERRAAQMLREAVVKPVSLHVPEGDVTRRLARRAALEQVALLRLPQWGLVDGVQGAELYEALERRFVGAGAKEAADDTGERQGFRKREADTYYFLHLVIQGRQADAERVLRTVAGAQPLMIPKRAIEALQRAGYDDALHTFLHGLLRRRPELRAWDVYMRQAAFTGNSRAALALVDELSTQAGLPGYVLTDLRFQRVKALLAADRIEPAVSSLQALLATPPQREERTLQSRSDAAIRLAGLGRMLKRADLAHAGLAFAQAVLALPGNEREGAWQRERLLREVFAEQRKLGLAEAAQSLAIAELQRSVESVSEMEQYGLAGAPGTARSALIELAGLFGSAGRHRDVLMLLDDSSRWGARDLRELLVEKDSLGVPLGLTAARALSRSGNSAAALALSRALVESLPAYDPAYELLLELDVDPTRYLDQVYARDRFEERPLIWKAIALSRQGRHLEAESLIRNAIVVDPSDGDEGPSDRMRAYAVLADILDARGQKEPAAQYRKAVSAIRVSERSDELHDLGMYERAFAGYRQALELFSDAYCIQSRLAVRLNEQGRRKEAFEHYRRAYELMPSSFGRVESHCFGCESVFQGAAAQGIAEKVFNELLLKDPGRPQVHYLLGYLHKEQGRHAEALPRFREAVRLDWEYLNAWKQLHELGAHVYVEPRERDTARLRLLELDPGQRHVRYETDSIGDLTALWRAVALAFAERGGSRNEPLYPLRRSAASLDEAMAKLPEGMRAQIQQYQAMMTSHQRGSNVPSPRQALARHRLISAVAYYLGARRFGQHLE